VDEQTLRKKHDRELIEILNELRVALPGAQVLFAFLLVVPFSSRFDVDRTEKTAYIVALFATLVGTILLIAPSAYHRLRWREKNKERMLRTANRMTIGGLVAIAIAMTASVFLVTDVLLPRGLAIGLTALAGVGFALAWFALPLRRPYDRWDDDEGVDE
jgi:predicted membrane channel-forming protein YqfA (hemolysin III family)